MDTPKKLKLIQTRECNGSCCEESPRFPGGEYSCIFRREDRCLLMTGEEEIPEGSEDLFIRTCKQWPQFWPAGRGTGNCCWEWVDGD